MSLVTLLVVFNSLYCSAFNCLYFFNTFPVLICRLWYQSDCRGLIIWNSAMSHLGFGFNGGGEPNQKLHGAKTHSMPAIYGDAQENGRLSTYLVRRSLSRRRGRSETSPTFISTCKGRGVTISYSCSSSHVNRLFSQQVTDWNSDNRCLLCSAI